MKSTIEAPCAPCALRPSIASPPRSLRLRIVAPWHVVTRYEGRQSSRVSPGVTPASHRARQSPTNAYKDSREQNVDTSCQLDMKHAADSARTGGTGGGTGESISSLRLSSPRVCLCTRVCARARVSLLSSSHSLAALG